MIIAFLSKTAADKLQKNATKQIYITSIFNVTFYIMWNTDLEGPRRKAVCHMPLTTECSIIRESVG